MYFDGLKNYINQQQKNAFEEFKRIAKSETANGSETLSLFRLVPQFSTASKEETDTALVCMRYWSRNGHGQWLIDAAQELFDGGYDPALHP